MKCLCIIILSLVFFSCSSKTSYLNEELNSYYYADFSDITYSNEPQCLSEFSDSISYILLDEEPLLDGIDSQTRIWIDKYIYIDIGDNVYKYTLDGKFVQKLFSIGQGPQEITQKLGSAIFNFENEYITIRDYGSNKYSHYSLCGDFVGNSQQYYGDNNKTKRIVGYNGDEEFYYWDYVIPSKGASLNIDGPHHLYVRNTIQDSIVNTIANYNYNIQPSYKGGIAINDNWPIMLGTLDSIIWAKPANVDTIYRMVNHIFEPWYIIQMKSSAANYSFRVNASLGHAGAVKEDIKYVLPLKNGLLYSYNGIEKGQEHGYGFCPLNGKAIRYSKHSFKNDLDNYLPYLKFNRLDYCYVKDTFLYVLVEASCFFENEGNPPFPQLMEDSNPIVVKLKLKSG